MDAIKWYKGVAIYPAGINSSGIRWTARVNGRLLRADTLNGIRAIISDALTGKST